MAQITQLEISANLWQNRNGQTMHRAYVTVNNRAGEQLQSEITYGYGRHYMRTAGAMLQAAGLADPTRDPYAVVGEIKRQGAAVSEQSQRVKRCKDL